MVIKVFLLAVMHPFQSQFPFDAPKYIGKINTQPIDMMTTTPSRYSTQYPTTPSGQSAKYGKN